MMNLFCCCSANSDPHAANTQITFPNDPNMDEGKAAGLTVPSVATKQEDKPAPAAPSPAPPAPAPELAGEVSPSAAAAVEQTAGAPSVSSRRELTAEEKKKEKERLQEMVKEFAKAVVKGQPARQAFANGELTNVTYSIDRSLKVFSLLPAGATEKRQIEMVQISEISKDPNVMPGQDIVSSLSEEHQKQVVALVYREKETSNSHTVHLVLPDTYERERFFTCMKILRWAMDSRK